MSEEGSSRGCGRVGCLGCTALATVVAALIAVAAVTQLVGNDDEPEDRQLSHTLPELPEATQSYLDSLGAEALPVLGDVEHPAELGVVPVSTLILDLSAGEFTLRPGPAGEPIRIEASFDPRTFKLREELTPSADGSWSYEVEFGPRWGLGGLVRTGGRKGPRVELIVPRGQPLDIEGSVGVGEAGLELGGLWLREVDLRLGTGEHRVHFSEPNLLPLERLRLRKSVGAFQIRDLGNANPRDAEVSQRLGELSVDLDGEWRQDGALEVNFGVGACRLHLPDGVEVDLKRARVRIGERRVDLPDETVAGAPTLKLWVSQTVGELLVY